MNPETNVSRVELSAKDAAVAVHAYDTHGYRIVGLIYEGAYQPQLETDGRLILDAVGATALKNCVFENVKYNLDFLYGKWVDYPEGATFKQGYIARHLEQQKIHPSPDRHQRMLAVVEARKQRLRNSQRVNVILSEFLEQLSEAEVAA